MCVVPSIGVVEISLLPVCTGDTSIYTRSSYREAVSTLHCALENGADLHVNEHHKIRHYSGSHLISSLLLECIV